MSGVSNSFKFSLVSNVKLQHFKGMLIDHASLIVQTQSTNHHPQPTPPLKDTGSASDYRS